jgi:hypothetical protein
MATNSLVDKNNNLPHRPRTESILARAEQVMLLPYPPRDGLRGHSAATLLAAFDAALPELEAALRELQNLGRPATKVEIAKDLALLVKSYPNSGTTDGEVYGRMLIEDVAAEQPAIGDLAPACRNIRRTSKFLPSISEVLQAIAGAKNRREDLVYQLTRLIKSRDRLVNDVSREQAEEEYRAYMQIVYEPRGPLDPRALPL